MTTLAEGTDRRATRPNTVRSLGWAFSMTFADRAVWRRIVAMAVGIGICSLALLGLASIPPSLDRQAATTAALLPIDVYPGTGTFSYHYVSFAAGDETVTGALLSGPPSAPPPPGASTFPQRDEIYASPRLAALLASPAGAEVRTLLPGRVLGVLPADRLRGADDLFFYRGADGSLAPKSEPGLSMSSASGWGRGASNEGLDPDLWILLGTGSVLLLIPLLLFIGLSSRLGSARRERRNGVLALLGAGRSRIRLIGAVESGTAGILGVGIGFAALLVIRQIADHLRFEGIGIRPDDIGPAAAGAGWISIGIIALAAVTGSLVGYRPADAARPQGSIPLRRRQFRWWWRILMVAVTSGALWWALQRSGSAAWGAEDEAVRVLLPCVLALLVMLTLVAVSAPLVVVVCRLWRPSSTAGQLARGRILADGAHTSRSAAGLATVLAGVITLLPLLSAGSASENSSMSTYGTLTGTVADVDLTESAARQSDGLEFIGISGYLGGDARFAGEGAQLAVANCGLVRRLDPAAPCQDGDVFRIPRTDSLSTALPRPPYPIALYLGQRSTPAVSWTPPIGTRQLATRAPSATDPLLNDVTNADFLLTPAAATGAFPRLTTAELTLTVSMQLRSGTGPQQRLAMANLGDRAFDVMRWNSTEEALDLFRPWIIGALICVAVLVLLICALAQILTTVEQIRERKRPYALGRAAGVPLSLLSTSIGLSLVIPILVTMVAAVGAGLVLNVVLGRLLELPASAIAWPVVGMGVGAAVLTAALVAAGASWSLQRSTRPAAMRTE